MEGQIVIEYRMKERKKTLQYIATTLNVINNRTKKIMKIDEWL